jgi:thiamine kinase-like enzyme
MFDEYDELARTVGAGKDELVVTHGEPHAANVMWSDDGLVLVDWDTTAIAPHERDLWMIEPRDDDDWAAYTSGGGSPDIDRTAIDLYKLWWALSEITGYTNMLRSPHIDDANTRLAWTGLQEYLG